MARISQSKREVFEASCGPFSLDVTLARSLGYNDDEIDDAHAALMLVARGLALSHAQRTGRSCEHCFAADAEAGYLPCAACGRKTVR